MARETTVPHAPCPVPFKKDGIENLKSEQINPLYPGYQVSETGEYDQKDCFRHNLEDIYEFRSFKETVEASGEVAQVHTTSIREGKSANYDGVDQSSF